MHVSLKLRTVIADQRSAPRIVIISPVGTQHNMRQPIQSLGQELALDHQQTGIELFITVYDSVFRCFALIL